MLQLWFMGFLLREVLWKRENYNVIWNKYVSYVERNYGKTCSIVFDGYKNITMSTKTAEHDGTTKCNPKVIFDESTFMTVTQQEFMQRSESEDRLMGLLITKFSQNGHIAVQADEDADVLQHGHCFSL